MSSNKNLPESEKINPNNDDTLIDFNGEDDPYKPLNWPMKERSL